MTRRVGERARTTILILTAVAGVLALGLLQYRWNREASDATGLRLADSLQLSMINWQLDLFRNLAEVCLAMPSTMDASAAGRLEPYVDRLAEWRHSARYPALVTAAYVIRGPAGAHQVLRLVPQQHVVESATLPPELGPVVDDPAGRLFAYTPSLLDAPAAVSPVPSGFSTSLRDWHFDPAAPAIVRRITGRPAAEWLVVELNRSVLQDRLLPDLAGRYFQGTDGLDYQVAVTTGGTPRRVLYTSDTEFGGLEVPDIDAWMNLFGRPLEPMGGSPLHVFQATSDTLRPTTAVGVHWFPLLHDSPSREDWQLIVRHRRGGSLRHFVSDLRRRGLVVSGGAFLLLVVSLSLVVVASGRAARLARLQMDFVTAVSHELRTPLTVIGSAADNLSAGVVDSSERLREYGAVIGAEVAQLSGLVERILLFAALREGRQRYAMEPLDVAAAIETAVANIEGLARSEGVTVERDIDPELPSVTADAFAVSQILENLMTNAIKYGRPARWIGIQARTVVDSRGTTAVHVSVSDRGMGIAPAELVRIFEPFYRGAAVRAAQIHGTGLGLSLARQLAEAMGGSVDATSVPGRGSTFTLRLFTGSLQQR
jgi:signal transduction histidine kinase